MANQFNIELTGKFVILKDDWIYIDSEKGTTISGSPVERVFKCEGGFGCKSFTSGTLIGGFVVSSGYRLGIRGYDYMERLATDEEVAEAESLSKNLI